MFLDLINRVIKMCFCITTVLFFINLKIVTFFDYVICAVIYQKPKEFCWVKGKAYFLWKEIDTNALIQRMKKCSSTPFFSFSWNSSSLFFLSLFFLAVSSVLCVFSLPLLSLSSFFSAGKRREQEKGREKGVTRKSQREKRRKRRRGRRRNHRVKGR